MRTQRAITALSILLLTFAAGCGGDDGPAGLGEVSCGTLGSFSGNATGTGASSLNGCSYYAVTEDTESDDGPVFGLVLTNGSGLNDVSHTVNIGRAGARPAAGTYNVGDAVGQFSGLVALDEGDRLFFLTSGTVTISTSTSNNLVGTLNITATEFEGSATITVTGNFTAKCVQGTSSGTTFTC